jgi:aerobic C4-dicarboxylate transport protein
MSRSAASAPARKHRPFYRDLSLQVLVGMVIGIAFGWLYPKLGIDMKPFGDAFIRMIQMVIGPVIFCTVVHGIAEAHDLKKVGRVAIKAIIYFEVATTAALIIAMAVANLLAPGAGMNIDPAKLDAGSIKDIAAATQHVQTTSVFLLLIIPKSIFDAFARGDILQILFFSVLFAGGLAAMGDKAAPVLSVIEVSSRSLFWIIGVAMKFAPLAAFGAMAFTIGQFGAGSLLSLAKLIAVFYLICFLFFILVLWPVIGTNSSETVFPQLTQKLNKMGCDESVVGLVLPTAYSFNHDGTCLYFAAASVFLAQATNTPMDWQHQLGLLLVLLLTSKGAAGVSGAALPVLAITLAASNTIPVASIALIIGIHRFLAAAFVFTNITGNSVATIVVAAWENALDRNRLKSELDNGYAPSPAAAEPLRA